MVISPVQLSLFRLGFSGHYIWCLLLSYDFLKCFPEHVLDWISLSDAQLAEGTFTVQSIWSRSKNNCKLEDKHSQYWMLDSLFFFVTELSLSR